jgi:hypothetical protein
MSVEDVLNRLIQKQAELADLDREIGPKIKAVEAKANQECEEIGKRAMREVDVIRGPFLKKLEEYRAEVKAKFGITDGEPMNVVQMLKSVNDMVKKNQSGLILP